MGLTKGHKRKAKNQQRMGGKFAKKINITNTKDTKQLELIAEEDLVDFIGDDITVKEFELWFESYINFDFDNKAPKVQDQVSKVIKWEKNADDHFRKHHDGTSR
ncbi:unnamed protein product [Cunninghamella blakesleeana]